MNRGSPLRVLLLSDGRPGHYHLADGVVAALERLRATNVERREIAQRWAVPARLLRALAGRRQVSPGSVLQLGYGLAPDDLPEADLVISAGGETLAANVAAARLLGAQNIFCGSLRNVAPESFSLVVTSYERFAHVPRHIVTVKPSPIDPDALGRPQTVPRFGSDRPPRLAGLLIGGDSGLFTYTDEEWHRLTAFVRAVSEAWGTRWLISTSRRTAPKVADAFKVLAAAGDFIDTFIDFRSAGAGTLGEILSRADVVVCTEDSSTMISEAVCARLPVIGVAPARHAFKAEEAEYRKQMQAHNWCRFLAIEHLSLERLGASLAAIQPLEENHLDVLAGLIRDRLPTLFED